MASFMLVDFNERMVSLYFYGKKKKKKRCFLSQYLLKPEHDLLYISYIIFVTTFLSLQLTYLIKSLLENEKMCKSEKYCNSC